LAGGGTKEAMTRSKDHPTATIGAVVAESTRMNAQYPTIDDGKIIEPFGW
jgi:hypothetical protein